MIILHSHGSIVQTILTEDCKRDSIELYARMHNLQIAEIEGDVWPLPGKILDISGIREKTQKEKFSDGEITEDSYKSWLIKETSEKINIERTERLFLPLEFNGHTFDADDISQKNISSILTSLSSGLSIPDPLGWRDSGNVTRMLSHNEIRALASAMIIRNQYIYAASWTVKDSLSMLTIAEIENFNPKAW